MSRIRPRRPSLPVLEVSPPNNRALLSQNQPNCEHSAMRKPAPLPEALHSETFSFQQHRECLQPGPRARPWPGCVECEVSQEGRDRVQRKPSLEGSRGISGVYWDWQGSPRMRNTGQWRVPEASGSELVCKEFDLHLLSSKPHPHLCLTLPQLPQSE